MSGTRVSCNLVQKGIEKSDLNFEPSIKILLRIIRSIHKNNTIGRTSLALESNINYAILSRYINWLESKFVIESVVLDRKVNICMTEKGRKFAVELDDFSLQFESLIDKISV